MDRFLQARELLDIVCLELAGDSKSLLSLLLTSLLFKEAALDALWYEIAFERPFVACLPEDAFIKEKAWPSLYLNKFILVPNTDRQLTSSDLQRFKTYYAPRIRIISAGSHSTECNITPAFLRTLIEITGSQPGALAPLLKCFRWDGAFNPSDDSNPLLQYMTLLLGECVTSLAIPTRMTTNESEILALTTTHSPILEILSLPYADPLSIGQLLKSGSWPNIRSLAVASIPCSAISLLASLPQLERLLFFSLEGITLQYAHSVSSNLDHFPALQHLEIECDDLETAACFLRHIPLSSPLRVLHCSAEEPTSLTSSKIIIDTITDCINRHSLETLVIRDFQKLEAFGDPINVEPSNVYGSAGIDINSLFEFTNLRKVVLQLEGRIEVTPSEVTKLATSWTQLEYLDLRGTYPIHRNPTIDHIHLLSIAEGCPNLQKLAVPFDARRIQGSERSANGPFPNIQLLSVCGSPVEYPACLAAYFMLFNFPSAGLTRTYPAGALISVEPSWECWGDVTNAMMPGASEGSEDPMEDYFS